MLKAYTTKVKIKQTGLCNNNNNKKSSKFYQQCKKAIKGGIQTTLLVNTQNVKITLISSINTKKT